MNKLIGLAAIVITGVITGANIAIAVDARSPALEQTVVSQIRSTLENLLEDMITPGKFSSAMDYLSLADKGRISTYAKNSFPELEAQSGQFNVNWKTRYNQSFSFNSEAAEIKILNYRFEPGRDKEHVHIIIPTSKGQEEIRMEAVNEGLLGSAWRINVADNIDGAAIKDKLQNNLRELSQDKTQWPPDKFAAAEMVARKVLSSLT